MAASLTRARRQISRDRAVHAFLGSCLVQQGADQALWPGSAWYHKKTREQPCSRGRSTAHAWIQH